MAKQMALPKQQEPAHEPIAKHAKAYTVWQKEIFAAAFANKQSQWQIVNARQQQGFDLNALDTLSKKRKIAGSLEQRAGQACERMPREINPLRKAFGSVRLVIAEAKGQQDRHWQNEGAGEHGGGLAPGSLRISDGGHPAAVGSPKRRQASWGAQAAFSPAKSSLSGRRGLRPE